MSQIIDELQSMVNQADIDTMIDFLEGYDGYVLTEKQILSEMPNIQRLKYSGDAFSLSEAFSAIQDAGKIRGGLDDAEGGYLVCKTDYRHSRDDRDFRDDPRI